MSEKIVHRRLLGDAMCGSIFGDLTSSNKYVTCRFCNDIIRRKKMDKMIRSEAKKLSLNLPAIRTNEFEYEQTIFSKSEKMHIELTSPFYQNLCKGFDIPSLGINVTPEIK